MSLHVVPPLPNRELIIRPLRESDIAPMTAAEREICDAFSYPYFVIRQHLSMYGDFYMVAVDQNRIAGFSLCPPRVDGTSAVLLGWGVLPEFRGKGIGRRLLDNSLARLRTTGVRSVELTVEPGNTTAITLYRRVGFIRARTEPGYFGPGEDRDIMTLTF